MVGDGIEFNDDQDNEVEDLKFFVPKQEQSRQFIGIYVQLPLYNDIRYISKDLLLITIGNPSGRDAIYAWFQQSHLGVPASSPSGHLNFEKRDRLLVYHTM
jgi:hypothetical protein